MSTPEIIVSILFGTAAGITLVMLYAPYKGLNSLKKTSKTGDDYIEDMRGKFKDFIEKMNDKYEAVREETEDHTHKSKSNSLKKNMKTSS